jgi:hypothetical protein
MPPLPSAPELKRVLESIVEANWKSMMPDADKGVIDVEYRLSPDHSIEYLRMWASSRWGFCDLICQYSMFWHWSNSQDIRFGVGYDSQPLANALSYVLHNQSKFKSGTESRNEHVQVHPPNEQLRRSAGEFVATVQRLPAANTRAS